MVPLFISLSTLHMHVTGQPGTAKYKICVIHPKVRAVVQRVETLSNRLDMYLVPIADLHATIAQKKSGAAFNHMAAIARYVWPALTLSGTV